MRKSADTIRSPHLSPDDAGAVDQCVEDLVDRGHEASRRVVRVLELHHVDHFLVDVDAGGADRERRHAQRRSVEAGAEADGEDLTGVRTDLELLGEPTVEQRLRTELGLLADPGDLGRQGVDLGLRR